MVNILDAPKIPLYGIKALYVDDEVFHQEADRLNFIVQSRLRRDDLLFADAFDSALETLEQTPEITVVLVDIRIPKNSQDYYDYNPHNPKEEWGKKLIQKIRQKYSKQRKIYIIVVSAYTTYTYTSEEDSAPILAFYGKPIEYDALAENLQYIVDKELVKGFDYSQLDVETSVFVQQQTEEIRQSIRKTAKEIIIIGQKLINIKEKLGYGNFEPWLQAEFAWTMRTARRFMNVADKFGDKSDNLSDFDASALYLLSAPSTPEEAREEALDFAQTGKPVSYTVAREIKNKYSKPRPRSKQVVQEQDLQSRDQSSQPVHRTQSPVPAADPSATGQTTAEKIAEKEIESDQTPFPAQPTSLSLPQKQALTPSLSPEPEIVAFRPQCPKPESWWQLGEHLLYCGYPASPNFKAKLPQNVSLTIAFPPDDSWNLAEPTKADSRVVHRSFYIDSEPVVIQKSVKESLLDYTQAEDFVVFCFLPDSELLLDADNLGCLCYVAEPDLSRCEEIIAAWKKKGGSALRLESLSA